MAGLLNYTKGYQGGGLYIPTSTRVRGQYGYLDRLFTEDIREKGEEAEARAGKMGAWGAGLGAGGKMLGMYLGKKMLEKAAGGALSSLLTKGGMAALGANPLLAAGAILAPTALSYLGKMLPQSDIKNPLTGKHLFKRPEDVKKGFEVDGRTSKFRQSEYTDLSEAMASQRTFEKEKALAETPGEAWGAVTDYGKMAIMGAVSERFGGKPESPILQEKLANLEEGGEAVAWASPASANVSGKSGASDVIGGDFPLSITDPSGQYRAAPFGETTSYTYPEVTVGDPHVMQTFPGATQSAGYGEGTRSQYRTLGDIDSNLIDPSAKIDPLMVPPAEDPFKKAALEYYRSPEGLEELGLTPPAQTVTERLADVGSAMYQRGPNYMQATTDVLGQLDVPAPDVLEGFRQGTGSPYNQFLGATGQYNPFGQQFSPRRQQKLMPSLLDYLGGGTGY